MADTSQSTAAEDFGEGASVNKSKKDIQENERLKMQ